MHYVVKNGYRYFVEAHLGLWAADVSATQYATRAAALVGRARCAEAWSGDTRIVRIRPAADLKAERLRYKAALRDISTALVTQANNYPEFVGMLRYAARKALAAAGGGA